jgi:hypothetical protein
MEYIRWVVIENMFKDAPGFIMLPIAAGLAFVTALLCTGNLFVGILLTMLPWVAWILVAYILVDDVFRKSYAKFREHYAEFEESRKK